MKIRDLTESDDKHRKPNSNDTLRDILTIMINTIQRFENSGNTDSKNDRDKIDILKNLITDMIKDEDQKRIIKGEQ